MQLTTDPNGFAQVLFAGLPRHYDFLEELLSLAQNGRWRPLRAQIGKSILSEFCRWLLATAAAMESPKAI